MASIEYVYEISWLCNKAKAETWTNTLTHMHKYTFIGKLSLVYIFVAYTDIFPMVFVKKSHEFRITIQHIH